MKFDFSKTFKVVFPFQKMSVQQLAKTRNCFSEKNNTRLGYIGPVWQLISYK